MVPGGKRGRVYGVALGLILLLTTGLADAFPQVKVDGVAPLAGSRVRIQASFLDRLGRAVPIDQLSRIVISRKDGRSRPVPVAEFEYGEALPLEETATVTERTASEAHLDLLVVAPATLAAPWGNPSGDAQLRKGLSTLLGGLAAEDRANVLWVGDQLHTFIPTRGKTGELSNLHDRYDDCIKAWEATRMAEPEVEQPTPGQSLGDLGDEACGLSSGHGDLASAFDAPMGHGGYYPNLFGVRMQLPNVEPEHPRQQLIGSRTYLPAPAMTEAFRMLLRPPTHKPLQQLVLVSDGEDGYLHAEADALLWFRQKACPKQLGEQATDKKIERCAQEKLDQFRAAEQERFARAAAGWLALARASQIRIHGIGFKSNPAQPDFLVDRIALLSQESGGTFRQAATANQILEHLTSVTTEIAGQAIIEFDSGMAMGEQTDWVVEMTVDQGNSFRSRPFPYTRPVESSGWIPTAIGDRLAWVEAKVGFYVYRAIVIGVAALMALLFLMTLWKGIKGAREKAQKRLEKERKAARKRAQSAVKSRRGQR